MFKMFTWSQQAGLVWLVVNMEFFNPNIEM